MTLMTLLETADQPAHGAFVEKKSEFIADACHVDSFDQALAFVDHIRNLHPKARHVAYASVYGGVDGQCSARMSDDGEPSGTAGKPILEVLQANGLTDCVVSVTRYFGGVLLGAGGLIRAYSTSASMAVHAAHVAELVVFQRYHVTLAYRQLAQFQQLVSLLHGVLSHEHYTDVVAMDVEISQAVASRFENAVRETFSATVVPTPVDIVTRAVADQNPM
jgi:uncharacterized YigZ family protein